MYKLPGSDLIPSEEISVIHKKICSGNCKLIQSVWNKEELQQQ
jgi:hypothetical protein